MPAIGSRLPAAAWLFANARPNERSMPMTSPVERISGPSIVSTSGKRSNGSTASFTATCPLSHGGCSSPSVAQLLERRAGHHPRRDLRQRHARRLADERNGAARARVRLDHEHLTVLHRVLHVEQARARRARRRAPACASRSSSSTSGVRVCGGIAHAESPECTPASSMCSMIAADHEVAGRVADRVDVDLDRVLEEAVDQRGSLGRQPALAPEAPLLGELGHRGVERARRRTTICIARPPSTYEGRTSTG